MSSSDILPAQGRTTVPEIKGKKASRAILIRIPILLDVETLHAIDQEAAGYPYRASIIRELLREGLDARRRRRVELAKVEAELEALKNRGGGL